MPTSDFVIKIMDVFAVEVFWLKFGSKGLDHSAWSFWIHFI